jgi:pathogenesis-related protein 1
MAQARLLLVALMVSTVDGVSEQEKWEMVDQHNQKRCMAGVPNVEWDDALAQTAQAYADTNPAGHSSGAFHDYGENMRAKCPSCSAQEAMTWWYAEKEQYVPGQMTAPHYTQVVWKGTTKIGCGKGKSTTFGCDGEGWTCQYSPKGNTFGAEGLATAYANNVIAPTKSEADCPLGGKKLRLYSDDIKTPAAPTTAGASTMAGLAVMAAAFVSLGVVVGYKIKRSNRVLPRADESEFSPMTETTE